MATKQTKTTHTYEHAWCAFLDIYGFSAMLAHDKSGKVLRDLEETQKDFIKILNESKATRFLVFSDSVLFFINARSSREQSFRRCNETAILIWQAAMQRDFFLRGSITYGSVTAGQNFILGLPVLRAVEIEKMMATPTVFVPQLDLETANIRKKYEDYFENIANKRGVVSGLDLIYHGPISFDELIGKSEKNLRKTAVSGPPEVALVWQTFWERSLMKKNLKTGLGNGK